MTLNVSSLRAHGRQRAQPLELQPPSPHIAQYHLQSKVASDLLLLKWYDTPIHQVGVECCMGKSTTGRLTAFS